MGNLYEDVAELKNDVVHYRQDQVDSTARIAQLEATVAQLIALVPAPAPEPEPEVEPEDDPEEEPEEEEPLLSDDEEEHHFEEPEEILELEMDPDSDKE